MCRKKILGIIVTGLLVTMALLYKPSHIDAVRSSWYVNDMSFVSHFFAELRILTNAWGMMPFVLWIGTSCALGLENMHSQQQAPHTVLEKYTYRLCAILFAIFMVVGKALQYSGEISVLYASAAMLLMTLISLIGYNVLFYRVILFLAKSLTNIVAKPATSAGKNTIITFIFEDHPFIAPFLLMVVIEIPYWLFFYPGTAMADALLQLTMYYGPHTLSNHHPVFSTLLMGGLNDVGRMIGDNNFGLFFYLFLQSITQFSVFSVVFVFAKKYKVDCRIRVGILAFFAFFPAFQIYAITLVKDTSFYIALFLFTLMMIGYWLDSKNHFIWVVGLLVTSVLTWMFRNTGFYVVLIGFISLMFKDKNWKRIAKLITLSAIILMLNTFYHNTFLPIIGCAEGSIREMLSIPAQQTARYCAEHADEIPFEEREILESVFLCTAEELGGKYNPELSNNTKESFLFSPTGDDLAKYFSLWWKQLLKHPSTYVNAALIQGYGYWYPDREVFDVIGYYDIPIFILSETENANLQFSLNSKFALSRGIVTNVHHTIARMPGVSYLYSCGFYTWIAVFLCAVLIANRKIKECAMALPLFFNIAVNCISPVNAYFRYQIPVIVTIPLFLIYVVVVLKNDTNVIDL